VGGDIHWVELPNVGGREQSGKRPAIFLQDDAYAGSLPTTIVVPLSSAVAALRFPGTALIKASLNNKFLELQFFWMNFVSPPAIELFSDALG
jgi:mRNA-degrading endonuclease toxin of MazEF toxin-antitoxin module